MLWGVSVQRLGEHLRCCPASLHRRWPYDCSPVIQNEIRSLAPASSPGQGPSCSTCFTGYLSFNHPYGILQMLESSQLPEFQHVGLFFPISSTISPVMSHSSTAFSQALFSFWLRQPNTHLSAQSIFFYMNLPFEIRSYWKRKRFLKKKDTSNSGES